MNIQMKDTWCHNCGCEFPQPTLHDLFGRFEGTYNFHVFCKPECNRYSSGKAWGLSKRERNLKRRIEGRKRKYVTSLENNRRTKKRALRHIKKIKSGSPLSYESEIKSIKRMRGQRVLPESSFTLAYPEKPPYVYWNADYGRF